MNVLEGDFWQDTNTMAIIISIAKAWKKPKHKENNNNDYMAISEETWNMNISRNDQHPMTTPSQGQRPPSHERTRALEKKALDGWKQP